MTEERIYELIAGYCDGSLTEAELSELSAQIRSDRRARRLFMQVRGADKLLKTLHVPAGGDPAWEKLRDGLAATAAARPRRSLRIAAWSAAAAAVAVAVWILAWPGSGPGDGYAQVSIPAASNKAILRMGTGSIVNLTDEEGFHGISSDSLNRLLAVGAASDAYNTIIVPRGSLYDFIMPDGTHIWLNSETEMVFPADMSGPVREVRLSGEAYLEVMHDAGRPFVVHAGGSTVRVLGTGFCVSAYPSDGEVVTTLVSGSVEFHDGEKGALLHPGQQANWNAGTGTLKLADVDVSLYTSWVHGVFEFQGMPLWRIARQLSRWYDVSFEFAPGSESLRDRLFTGTFESGTPLEEILRKVAATTDMDFSADGRKIVVGLK